MRYPKLLAPATLIVLTACQDVTQPTTLPDGTAPALQRIAGQQSGPERVMPGRVLARFEEGVQPAAVAGAYGLTVAGVAPGDAFVMLNGAVGSERALAARLGSDDRVVFAEPDYLRQPTAIDPRLWAFYNPGGLTFAYSRGRDKGTPITSYASFEDADEDNVEGYAAGGSAVVIGSIDTGVDLDHPEFLPGQLIPGHDWYSNDSDPSDENGHGTHTSGTMAGRTVGVAGVAGAGSNVQIHVQRVCGALGCPTSAIANAIRAAADVQGMVAMNLSLGGGSLGQAESSAIAYATSLGVLVIASAGNDDTGTVSCPACDPNAISVAASNWRDELAYYTNYGPGLDITAPGGELYSNTTDEGGIYSAYTGGTYQYLQGTSMAAPQVTGTAGIVASVAGLSGAALRARIEGTVDDLGVSGYDTQFGHGRLNSYRAVTNSELTNDTGGSGEPPPPPPPPSGDLTASFSYSCGGSATCDFDASASTGASSYSWTFGDGGTGSGVTAQYTYPAAGEWTVTLTVGDGSDTASSSQTLSCRVRNGRNSGSLRCS